MVKKDIDIQPGFEPGVFWIPVRRSYQVGHWSSGIWVEDKWHLSISTVQFSGWISLLGLVFNLQDEYHQAEYILQ